MTTIDQRIRIPMSPEVVWDIISDVEQNPKWQTDCRSITRLNNVKGQGLRYRASDDHGRDYVVEITAWYDRVGYAYTIVDSAAYSFNQGTLRLQDTPDGTVVQWMFEYEPKGVFGGLRDAVSTRRNVENNIITGLEQLWRLATQGQPRGEYVSKAMMRSAPDVESRANYEPEHDEAPAPSVRNEGYLPASNDAAPAVDDTSTSHAADESHETGQEADGIDTAARYDDTPREPDFLRSIEMPPVTESRSADVTESPTDTTETEEKRSTSDSGMADTQETAAVNQTQSDEAEEDTPAASEGAEPAGTTSQPVISQEAAEDPVESEPQPTTEPRKPYSAEAEPPKEEKPAISEATDEPNAGEAPRSAPRDNSDVSVFDIFGVPRPSEASQTASPNVESKPPAPEPAPSPPVRDEPPAAFSTEPAAQPQPMQHPIGRIGYRLLARGKLVRLRRPK